jgi:superfamily II DNA/RNA helicase
LQGAEAGPLAVILAPTREQVQRIEAEVVKLTKYTDYRFVCVAGGLRRNRLGLGLWSGSGSILC